MADAKRTNPRAFEALEYIGRVDSVRQRYYVYEGGDGYVILTFSEQKKGSGNFNVVPRRAVEYVHQRFAGSRGVTSTQVVKQARRTLHAPDNLAALGILYVLTALGAASIEGVGERRQRCSA
jgi:hypothetical protein